MRAQRSVLSFALSGLTLVTATALADDSNPAETVVITATGVPTPESQVASSITVVTAADIEARQLRSLPEVLNTVPGLNIVETGGPGGQTSVFLRGTNSNHTKVLIDGIDVGDPSNSNASFDYSQLLAGDIEKVEVLRGPQSGLYGSDAIGGVINIITRKGNGPAQLTASAEGGSFDTFNQAGHLSGSSGGFHYSANVQHFHSGATPVTPKDLLQPGEQRNDDYYDNVTGSTNLSLDVSDILTLGLVARETSTHLRITGDTYLFVPPYTGYPSVEQSEATTMETYGRVYADLTTGILHQTLGVDYTRKRSADYEPESPTSLYTGERTKVDWRGIVQAAKGETVVVGAEYERNSVSGPLSASDNIASGYAELQSQLGAGLSTALNVRYDSHNRFGGKTTYRFAPTYVIAATGTQLKASIGTGFKAPTLSELYQDYPAYGFYANPDLKPETSTGWDAGIEQDLGSTVRLGATWYHNRLHDLIADNDTFTSYTNIGRVTTQGVESFVAWQPVQSFTFRVDYTFTEATDDLTGLTLLRRPKHKASATTTWQATSHLNLSATVLTVSSWVDGNRDFSIPRLNAPSYTTVNLAGSYDVNRSLRVYARVNNLFDRHYENPVGFLQPSLGAYGGVEVKL